MFSFSWRHLTLTPTPHKALGKEKPNRLKKRDETRERKETMCQHFDAEVALEVIL